MTSPPLLPRERRLRALAAALIAALLAVLAVVPSQPKAIVVSPCVFHSLTGLPCALCGGTRAARALMSGDFARAVAVNAIAIPAMAVLLLSGVILILEAIANRPLFPWARLASRPLLLIAVALLLLWWIPHVAHAIRTPNSELLDLRNPMARHLHKRFAAPP